MRSERLASQIENVARRSADQQCDMKPERLASQLSCAAASPDCLATQLENVARRSADLQCDMKPERFASQLDDVADETLMSRSCAAANPDCLATEFENVARRSADQQQRDMKPERLTSQLDDVADAEALMSRSCAAASPGCLATQAENVATQLENFARCSADQECDMSSERSPVSSCRAPAPRRARTVSPARSRTSPTRSSQRRSGVRHESGLSRQPDRERRRRDPLSADWECDMSPDCLATQLENVARRSADQQCDMKPERLAAQFENVADEEPLAAQNRSAT